MNYLYIYIVVLTGLIVSCEKAADAPDEETIILATSFEKTEDVTEDPAKDVTEDSAKDVTEGSIEDSTAKDPVGNVQSKVRKLNVQLNELKPKLDVLRVRVEALKQKGEPGSAEELLQTEAALEELSIQVKQLQSQRSMIRAIRDANN